MGSFDGGCKYNLVRTIESGRTEMAEVGTVVILGGGEGGVVAAAAIGSGDVGAITGERVGEREVDFFDAAHGIEGTGSVIGGVNGLIGGASGGEVHEVRADGGIDATEGGLGLAENGAGEGSAEGGGGIEAVAGEVDDAGGGNVGEIAGDGGLRTATGGVGDRTNAVGAGIGSDGGVDGVDFSGVGVEAGIGIGAIGEEAGVADVIGVNAKRKLSAEFADVIDGEHAADAHLTLDAGGDVDYARSAESGSEQATEVGHASGEGIDIGAGGNGGLSVLELLLEILNGGGDDDGTLGAGDGGADGLAADLAGDVEAIDGINDGAAREKRGAGGTEGEAAIELAGGEAVDAILIRILEKEIVVEDSGAGADDGAAAVTGIPGKTDLRREIVMRIVDAIAEGLIDAFAEGGEKSVLIED